MNCSSAELVEEGIDTIGGLIFNRLGTLPKPGTMLEVEGVKATVRRTSRKRIEEVLIEHEVEPGQRRRGHDLGRRSRSACWCRFSFPGSKPGCSP